MGISSKRFKRAHFNITENHILKAAEKKKENEEERPALIWRKVYTLEGSFLL